MEEPECRGISGEKIRTEMRPGIFEGSHRDVPIFSGAVTLCDPSYLPLSLRFRSLLLAGSFLHFVWASFTFFVPLSRYIFSSGDPPLMRNGDEEKASV